MENLQTQIQSNPILKILAGQAKSYDILVDSCLEHQELELAAFYKSKRDQLIATITNQISSKK